MPSSTPSLGEALQTRMVEQRLSLQELSKRSRVPLSTLDRKLKVDPESFKLSELRRIAEALGTTAGTIVLDHEAAS